LETLHGLFADFQTNGLLSAQCFWSIVGLANPAYLLRTDSLFNARVFSIFDVLKLGALTCLEFILALGVLSAHARFLDPVAFSFDVLDVNQVRTVEAIDIMRVLQVLDDRSSADRILCRVRHGDTIYSITPVVLQRTFVTILQRYTSGNALSKPEWQHVLMYSSASPLLLALFCVDVDYLYGFHYYNCRTSFSFFFYFLLLLFMVSS
jgi:hypothetical protein